VKKSARTLFERKKRQTVVMRLSRDLPPFKIYAEFIIKSGLIELKNFRFDFKAEPNVE